MKLKTYSQSLSEKLSEFDYWITPSLSEIKDSSKFQIIRDLIANVLDQLGSVTNGFSVNFTEEIIVDHIIDYINENDEETGKIVIDAFLKFLFLVTGKSDNNCKCQFPVYLTQFYPGEGYPNIKKTKGKIGLIIGSIPRTIKSDTIVEMVSRLSFLPETQKSFMLKYVKFILNNEVYQKSLKAIGLGYVEAKANGIGLEFLLPLVVFQIRGSESAKGGHKPEKLLRNLMLEWGLFPGDDFNIIDHIVADENEEEEDEVELSENEKTRAYDFFLPLSDFEVTHKILIQSQFYAGDSGSVSHKTIDQAIKSRNSVKTKLEKVYFVEFLDGAGYYSSLNGDLKKILEIEDTYDFFQIRTAVIKLRRIFQKIGFLTPLEIWHASNICEGGIEDIKKWLMEAGYTEVEVHRALDKSVKEDFIYIHESGSVSINPFYNDMSRRYFLLDSICNYGISLDPLMHDIILVPGYSRHYGISKDILEKRIIPSSGKFRSDWQSVGVIEADIMFLTKNQWIKVL